MICYFLSISLLIASEGQSSWHLDDQGLSSQNGQPSAIAFSLSEPTALYLAWGKTLYSKQGAQQPWAEQNSFYEDIVQLKAKFYPEIWVLSSRALWKKQAIDQEWKEVLKSPSAEEPFVHFSDLGSALFVSSAKKLYRSLDNGQSWKRLKNSDGPFLSMVHFDSLIWAISEHALFVSDNQGKHWREVLRLKSEFQDAPSAESQQDNGDQQEPFARLSLWQGQLLVAHRRGLWRYEAQGNFWQRIGSEGLQLSELEDVQVIADKLYALSKHLIFVYDSEASRWVIQSRHTPGVSLLEMTEHEQWGLYVLSKKGAYRFEQNQGQILSVIDSDRFRKMPSVQDVQDVAIRYAEVHPHKIAAWRKQARKRAWLPDVSLSVSERLDDTYEIYTSSSTSYAVNGPNDRTLSWDARLSWDLADVVYSSEQTTIDNRSKLMVQLREDVLSEVTRLYFARKRLLLQIHYKPHKDHYEQLSKQVQLEELTAGLDAYTGGWFSRQL